MSHIPISSLNATFADAVRITRKLNIRYLWIDSLCIIRDLQNEWESESSQMGLVYENGIVNIMGSAAMDGDYTFLFQRSSFHLLKFFRRWSWTVRIMPDGYDSNLWNNILLTRMRMDNHVANRGWVVQERLLSPRTIHFKQQWILWECKESAYVDFGPEHGLNKWKCATSQGVNQEHNT